MLSSASTGWPVDTGSMVRLAVAVFGGALLSLMLDRLVKPAAAGLRRDAASTLIALGSYGLMLGVVLALFQRALFAAAATLAAQLLVVLVSNAKHRALREPFVFTDFSLFAQAFRHPRLYLPFLGVRRGLLAAAACTAAIYLGLIIEPRLGGAPAVAAIVLMAAVALLALGLRFAAAVCFDPVTDIRRVGLVASLWLYWIEERRRSEHLSATPWPAAPAGADALRTADLPDMVVVQSESFFDVRRLHPDINADVLRKFDELRRSCTRRGRLHVPAWGANTMRTEFAFLTGIGAAQLGVHRFNPYRHAAHSPVAALPAYLRSLGYRTVCIHPHLASFFQRHKVLPNLGFDEFIDITAFDGATRAGPYVADEAVTRKIAQVLAQPGGPVFVFAITMENHGPLHLERATAADIDTLYARPPAPGFDDLTIYLRHLVNADRMLGELADLLRTRTRDGLLCFFGDHVPSMPAVYDAMAFADPRTDYLIWRKGGGLGPDEDARVEQLGAMLVAIGGSPGGPGAMESQALFSQCSATPPPPR